MTRNRCIWIVFALFAVAGLGCKGELGAALGDGGLPPRFLPDGSVGAPKTVHFPAGACEAEIELGTLVAEPCGSIDGVEVGVNGFSSGGGCILAGSEFQRVPTMQGGDCVQMGEALTAGLYARCVDPNGERDPSEWVGPAMPAGTGVDVSICARVW